MLSYPEATTYVHYICSYIIRHLVSKFWLYIICTGKSLSEAIIFASTNPQYMTTDCSLNYKFNTWKFQAQTWGKHVVYRNCFWHSEQFLYTTSWGFLSNSHAQHVLPMFCKKKSFWQRFTCIQSPKVQCAFCKNELEFWVGRWFLSSFWEVVGKKKATP